MTQSAALRLPTRRGLAPAVLALLLLAAWPLSGLAHEARLPVEGKKIVVRTDGDAASRMFSFWVANDDFLRLNHDPRVDTTAIVVQSHGAGGTATSGLITLDPALWAPTTSKKGEDESGYVYRDPSGSRGGITSAIFRAGELRVQAQGEGWPLSPSGAADSMWVHFRLEDEWYCSAFGDETQASIRRNQPGYFLATSANPPLECPEQVCGNGELELGEDCDDGNRDEEDGCTTSCTVGQCTAESFDSTFEAIQSVVFESPIYGCTSGICHDAFIPEAGLVLEGDAAYASLLGEDGLGAPSQRSTFPRVKPAEPAQSFLYLKLAAAQPGSDVEVDGSPMPFTGNPLTPPHLEAIREWIRSGAQQEGVVENTAQLLGTCLPEPTPLQIPPEPPPPTGVGLQLRQTPRVLDANSESEICMAVYYDFTQSDLVPESARGPCPDRFQFKKFCSDELTNGGGILGGGGDPTADPCSSDDDCDGDATCVPGKNALNPESECFYYDSRAVKQDPQSHHSIGFMYSGRFDTSDTGWHEWRYRFRDESNELEGQPCDPLDVDPALGVNPGCSTDPFDSVACLFYGPPDYSNFGSLLGGGGNAPQVFLTQEPFWENEFPSGAFDALPMKGVFVWNSHAFNLTNFDTTLQQYFNVKFAAAPDQQWDVQDIFDAGSIFVQYVPPFETQEYCRTWTAPEGAEVFYLASHTHQRGTRFRIWGPPNEPCIPDCDEESALCFIGDNEAELPTCQGPRPNDEAIYFSTEYADPEQLYFDPPVVHDSPNVEDRTYLYCALYDNGSTSASPPVKRRSTSPDPPPGFPPGLAGGPCPKEELACLNEGPKKGTLCGMGGNKQVKNARCDSFEGAGDGVCDACPLRGGVTTEDEMFILLGAYYVP